MPNNDQEKIAMIKKIADFPKLQENHVLMHILNEALKALPDSEKGLAEYLIIEQQKKCKHDGDKILKYYSSSGYQEMVEQCCLCGKITRKDLNLADII
ncbi:MAG: hypothetical protein RI945_407 [Candidatus Parcubacteria bacterium]|jgi:CHAD domain-containing protein